MANAPTDDRLLNNIGRCYAELGQRDSAFMYFQKALEINPENSYIYHNRAALYYDIKRYDFACMDLKLAIDKEYNWIIDSKLIEMKKKHCPDVNTDVKVLIYEYKGNVTELARYNFIQLSDSLLNESIDITIKENTEAKVLNEENRTIHASSAYHIYPNPTNGTFHVETQTEPTEVLTVKVYNSEGKLVLSDTIFEHYKNSFDLKHARAGTYVVIISNRNSVLSTKKILIEN